VATSDKELIRFRKNLGKVRTKRDKVVKELEKLRGQQRSLDEELKKARRASSNDPDNKASKKAYDALLRKHDGVSRKINKLSGQAASLSMEYGCLEVELKRLER
jgi:uncharacterized protein (DUF3084 family)